MFDFIKEIIVKNRYNKKIKSLEHEIIDYTEIKNHIKEKYDFIITEILTTKDIKEIFKYAISYNSKIYEKEDLDTEIDKYPNLEEIKNIYAEMLSKKNELISIINEHICKNNRCFNLIEDIKARHSNGNIVIDDAFVFKFGFDKEDKLLCFYFNIASNEIDKIDSLKAFVCTGMKDNIIDLPYIKCIIHTENHSHLKICDIDVGVNKRMGIGSFALRSLEDTLLKEMNYKINIFNIKNQDKKINNIYYIHGTMNNASKEINNEIRQDFFIKNNYSVEGSYFHKSVKR